MGENEKPASEKPAGGKTIKPDDRGGKPELPEPEPATEPLDEANLDEVMRDCPL